MKAMTVLLALVLTGCASSAPKQPPVVPALAGQARVPINKEIPARVPLTQGNEIQPQQMQQQQPANQED